MFVVRCCFSSCLVAEPSLHWARNSLFWSVLLVRVCASQAQVSPHLALLAFDCCFARENTSKGLVFEPVEPLLLVPFLEGHDELSYKGELAEFVAVWSEADSMGQGVFFREGSLHKFDVWWCRHCMVTGGCCRVACCLASAPRLVRLDPA